MPTYYTPYYPEGDHVITEKIVIPRRRSRVHSPGPYQATWAQQKPAGRLHGADREGSVLIFDTAITGALIETEGYDGSVARWWNADDPTNVLCATIERLTILGQAELRAYPYNFDTVNGKQHPLRAAGIRTKGMGGRVIDVSLHQIPGWAIYFASPGGANSSAYSVLDKSTHIVDNVNISHAVNGIYSDAGLSDSKIRGSEIQQIALDGLVVHGGVVQDMHIWGCDRSTVVISPTTFKNNYLEAARIGCYFASTAGGSHSIGHNIGPATCWEHGIYADSRITVEGLYGTVLSGAVGVELADFTSHHKVVGELAIPNGAKGVVVRAHTSRVDLLFASVSGTSIVCKIHSSLNPGYSNFQLNRLDVRLTGYSATGTVLDLTNSELEINSRLGEAYHNVFRIYNSTNNANQILYPGGGTTYNLKPGNHIFINDSAVHDNVIIGVLNLGPTTATIAAGVIAASGSYMKVDTEAAAATDDLDSITGGVDGDILILRAANAARTVVVKDGTNLKLAGDCTLDNTEDSITLLHDGTNWVETARSNNGA